MSEQDLSPAESNQHEPLPQTIDGAIPERPGSVIGPYKLLEQIGEGGFGVVFMAEQQQPIRRKVALKVLKPGMDTRQVVARFEAERQALALMDHPNIARVYDGGATSCGRPFFVMELVKGVPITEFCDEHRLTPRQRLELFISVCQAVQHAHQKAIIHRDLKPSNVLVSIHDTVPVVKVIDFGVAKALGHELTDKTVFTGFAQIVGTPLYMSPEQAGQSGVDIDTRSDIYSLGVLLYELLTGATPFDKNRFKKAGYDEICRIIRDEEPPKPSTRLSQSKDSLPSVCTQRQTEPARLMKLVRGELDWIVMKCLEKDRNRRYETASGLANDIERYLHDEPVEACPPSAAYRLRKFVRRNKGRVLAACLVFLALMGGIIGTSIGLIQAEQAHRREAERADGERRAKEEAQTREAETRAVLDFVENKVFAAARPAGVAGGLGHDVTLRKAVEAALPFVEKSFKDQPLIEARLRMTLGSSFSYLGEARIAADQFAVARKLYTQYRGPDHSDTLNSMHALASSYSTLGMDAEALTLREVTLALRKSKLGPDHQDTLRSMTVLANSYGDVGRHEEALKLREETLALQVAKLGPEHPDTLNSMNNLANSYFEPDRQADALKLREKTLALFKSKLGPDHPDTLRSMNNLASSYSTFGRHDEALKLREETLALMKYKLGQNHPSTLHSMNSLAQTYITVDRRADAEALLDELVRLRPDLAFSHFARGDYFARYGKWDKAAAAYERGLELETTDHTRWCSAAVFYLKAAMIDKYRWACRQMLARFSKSERREIGEQIAKTCLVSADGAGELENAIKLAERTVTNADKNRYYSFFQLTYGLAGYRAGRYESAHNLLSDLRLPVKWKANEAFFDTVRCAVLAMARHRLGRIEEARASLATARALLAEKMPNPDQGRPFGDPFGQYGWNDWLQAQILFQEAEELLEKEPRPK